MSELIFTDDKLERWKQLMPEKADCVTLPAEHMNALFRRLDAAERVCLYVEIWLVRVNPNTDIEPVISEWRKASGK